MRLPRRRWFVGTTLDWPLRPDWQVRVEQGSMWRFWTYEGARRRAHRWNTLRLLAWPNEPALFEVYGPLGKGDD